MPAGSRSHRLGYMLPTVLLLVALTSLGLAAAGPLWSQSMQRDRERELMRVGLIYAQALAAYRDASPGAARQLPLQLEDLLLDQRFVGTRRHLRRLYPDPVAPASPWQLETDAEGRITGVYSSSQQAPIAQGPVHLADRQLPPARRYADWKFTALPSP